MLVSGGYPESYRKGFQVNGLDRECPSLLFHSGTSADEPDHIVKTSGGRVLAVTSLAGSMSEALKISYKTASGIDFQGKTLRKDLGFDLI